MTPDEARARFSEAYEGDLDAAERAAFDALLAEDGALAEEYREFVETVSLMGRLADADADAAPDLLPAVQSRLRRRSRGRYYRDRFAERAGGQWLLGVLAVLTLVLVLALAWVVWRFEGIDASPKRHDPGSSALR
ncbi:MAG: hypothetical protein ACFCGT_17675 [Sandaracinaceae bacterium]